MNSRSGRDFRLYRSSGDGVGDGVDEVDERVFWRRNGGDLLVHLSLGDDWWPQSVAVWSAERLLVGLLLLLLLCAGTVADVGVVVGLGDADSLWLVLFAMLLEADVFGAEFDDAVAAATATDDDDGVLGCDDAGGGDDVSRCRKSDAGRDVLDALDRDGARKRSASCSESRRAVLWLVISASPLT